jgi:hypothetical protein
MFPLIGSNCCKRQRRQLHAALNNEPVPPPTALSPNAAAAEDEGACDGQARVMHVSRCIA